MERRRQLGGQGWVDDEEEVAGSDGSASGGHETVDGPAGGVVMAVFIFIASMAASCSPDLPASGSRRSPAVDVVVTTMSRRPAEELHECSGEPPVSCFLACGTASSSV